MFVHHILIYSFASVWMISLVNSNSFAQDQNDDFFDPISLDSGCEDTNNQPIKERAMTGSPDDSMNRGLTGLQDDLMDQASTDSPDGSMEQEFLIGLKINLRFLLIY